MSSAHAGKSGPSRLEMTMSALVEYDTPFGLISARDHQIALAVIAMFTEEQHRACESDLIEAITWTYE